MLAPIPWSYRRKSGPTQPGAAKVAERSGE
jgi:hypothetical protein